MFTMLVRCYVVYSCIAGQQQQPGALLLHRSASAGHAPVAGELCIAAVALEHLVHTTVVEAVIARQRLAALDFRT